MRNRIAVTSYVALMLISVASLASGAAPNFQITEVFSNGDGSIQFIELTQTSGWGNEQHLAGTTLTMSHNGVVKTYTIPHDIPPSQGSVLLGTAPGAPLEDPDSGKSCKPDFVIPFRFIATDGGTIDFAGADEITYEALPTDGKQGLYRDGVHRASVADSVDFNSYCAPAALNHGFCFCSYVAFGRLAVSATEVTVVEYYDIARDHYFMTASAPDIDALDSGRIAGWQRTALYFPAQSTFYYLNPGFGFQPDADPAQPVCRMYIPPQDGDSHFFSAFADECAQVIALHPEYVLESPAAFYAGLPDAATGVCPNPYLIPVYRLWNQRVDSNHRFTANVLIRQRMLQRGYVAEGYGPDGVAFCVYPETYPRTQPSTMVEYYNSSADHYFSTANELEISRFDSGQVPGWDRTGWTFTAANSDVPDVRLPQPLCRFYMAASDSHFYAASADECSQVAAQHPEYVSEGNADVYVAVADPTTGQCPQNQGLIPVFRLWNQRADTNHRYVTNVFVRNSMLARGYLPEGFGPNGVAFCVPGGATSP